MADRVGSCAKSRIKNNVPNVAISRVFRYTLKRYGDIRAEARTKATVLESQSSDGALQRVRQGDIDMWHYRKLSRELTQQFMNEVAALLHRTIG